MYFHLRAFELIEFLSYCSLDKGRKAGRLNRETDTHSGGNVHFYIAEVANNLWLYLVSGCEFGPWFVSTTVIVLGVCDLHVLVEAQDLSGL